MIATTLKLRVEHLYSTLIRNFLILTGITTLIVSAIVDKASGELAMLLVIVCVLVTVVLKIKSYEKIIIIFIIGITLFVGHRAKMITESDLKSYVGAQVQIHGVVVQQPILSAQRQRVVLKVQYLIQRQEVREVKGRVILSLSKFEDLSEGDELELYGQLAAGETFDGFDYQAYLDSVGIDATLENPRLIEKVVNTNLLLQVSNTLRDLIRTKALRLLPEPHASLLIGMLIGTKEQFTKDFATNLATTGTAHIIAVSGFNITLLIGLVMSVAGYIPRKMAFGLCVAILILFLTIVGFNNLPALRATIMGSVTLLGNNLGRKTNAAGILMLTLAIMLWLNPLVYRSLSFQLSFAATLGLMTIAKQLESWLPKFLGTHIRAELGVTLAAIMATFPITFASFGKLSPYAPLVNLVVAPLVPIIMLAGFLMIICSLMSDVLAQVVAIAVWVPLDIMTRVINTFAQLPGSDLAVAGKYQQVIALVVLFLVLCIALESSYREIHSLP